MQVTSNRHLADESLEKYAMGKLDEHRIPALEEHLLVCSDCQLRMADMDDYVVAATAAARELDLKKAVQKPRWMPVLSGHFWYIPKPMWAAGIAAALVISAVIPFAHRNVSETEVYLSTLRGSDTVATGHGKVTLKIDASTVAALPAYRLQLVDSSGSEIWQSRVISQNGRITARVPNSLTAGKYWVRLFSETDSSQPLQELALHVD